MIRAFSIILCVLAGVSLANILLVYMASWVLLLVSLLAFLLWGYAVDKGFKDQ